MFLMDKTRTLTNISFYFGIFNKNISFPIEKSGNNRYNHYN